MNRRHLLTLAGKFGAAATILPFVATSPAAQEAVERLSVEIQPLEGEAGAIVVPLADNGGVAFEQMESGAFRVVSDAPDWVNVGAVEADGTIHTAEAFWTGTRWESVAATLDEAGFQVGAGYNVINASLRYPELNTAPEQQRLAALFSALH